MKHFACTLLFLLAALPTVASSDSLEEVNFPLNSSIVVDAFQGLDVLAAALGKHDNLDLEVIGYTDSQGTNAYNIGLSQRRADSVKEYLVSHGAKAEKIAVSAKGEQAPYNNLDREGRFKNRSVSLTLFETVNGNRAAVDYKRLLELLFGSKGQTEFVSPGTASKGNDDILIKLSDLQKQVDEISQRLKDLSRPAGAATAAYSASETPATSAGMGMSFGGYNGVSIQVGADQDGEIYSNVRGLYLHQFNESFALQGQGNYSHAELANEGQLDGALIYREGPLKVAAAASYKFVSLGNYEDARLAQGSMILNYTLENATLGFFSTTPLLEGDVIASGRTVNSPAFITEQYLNVPEQVGLTFGANLGERTKLSLFGSKVYAEGDADKSAGLNLEFKLFNNFNVFLDATMNGSGLQSDDDSMTYTAGMKLGSWANARFGHSDDITPMDIPSIRYEILTRTERVGNSAPIAKAGDSRTGVAAGTITLDGRGSSDPEGDALTYKWVQIAGNNVTLATPNAAVTTFTGKAGEAYRFQLTVTDRFGATANDTISITMVAAPIPDPVIHFLTLSPNSIPKGEMASLSWSTVNATSVNISHVGDVIAAGSVLVSPEENTTYTITASNGSKTVTRTASLTVVQPPPPPPVPAPVINFLNATPTTISEGQFTTLNWNTQHAETVTLLGFGRVNVNGSIVLAPDVTTTYTMTATNETGSVSKTVTVSVVPVPPPNHPPIANAGFDQIISPPGIVTLDGSGSLDPDGDTLIYEWTQTAGLVVTLSGADTAHPTFAGVTGYYEFRLTVSDGRGGFDVDSVKVDVLNFKN